jgi:large subunit ribosomal protein L6
MSRVGKMPVTVPAGVDVSIKEDQISVKGSGRHACRLAQNALVKVDQHAGRQAQLCAGQRVA